MQLPKKIISGLLVTLIVFTLQSLVLTKVSAQTTSPSAVSSSDIQKVFLNMGSALTCFIAGVDIVSPQNGCVEINPTTGALETKASQQKVGGLVGGMSNMIGFMYQKPVSTTESIKYFANSFGIAKKSFAADTGFDKLSPLQEMWLKLRNITFVFMVLLFVFIGMGIMLRVKIDPRTVMSIQNQLPKIILTLIFITFSFSIAGLLVDAMWFTTYTGISILVPDKVTCVDPQDSNTLTTIESHQSEAIKAAANRQLLNNPIVYVNELFGNSTGCEGSTDGIAGISIDAGGTVGKIISDTVTDTLDLKDANCSADFWNTLGACAQSILHGLVRTIATILFTAVLLFAIFFALIRLWFALLRAYAYTLIGTMIAPLYIAAGLIPGSKFGFTAWLRYMLAHLSVFPVAAFFFVAARVVSTIPTYSIDNATAPTTTYFLPPLIGNPAITNHIQGVLVVAILLITPEVLVITRQTFRSEPNKLVSGAIQGGIGRGFGPATLGPRALWKRTTAFDPHKGQVGFVAGYINRRLPKAFKNINMSSDEGRAEFTRRAYGGPPTNRS